MEGHARAASDAPSRLEFVTSFVTEWYGWSQHHPTTSVYVVAG